MLVAIDPGVTTGFAWCDPTDPLGTFNSAEVSGWMNAAKELQSIAIQNDPTYPAHIVCERFDITMQTIRTHAPKASLWLEGAIQLQCETLGWPFEFQDKHKRKWATRPKLEVLGWLFETKDDHAADASAHLLVYMIDNHIGEYQSLLEIIAEAGA